MSAGVEMVSERPEIKVSVIVPTYRPGESLARVIASLDAQTLAPSEFESIFIDDGSPDDTYERLLRLQHDRPNMSVHRIENSGWSSRPRNVAIERARGEYVLFMDHDDYLHPEALESLYAFAAANNADVVNPKESKTRDVAWGLEGFTENVPNARDSRGIESLMPMMPHKLYRLALLLDHDIRFPEGRRMFWEDVCFNVLAYRHASVISVLADTPVYRWVDTGENNSSSYGPADDEFWNRLDELFTFIDDALADDEHREARNTVIAHVFRTRVLGRLYPWLAEKHETDPAPAVARARAIAARHVPESADELMGMRAHAESAVLRSGAVDAMRELRRIDTAIVGLSYTDRVEWEGDALVIAVKTTWDGPEGTRLELRRRGGRIVRVLPEGVERFVPMAARDVTEQLALGATTITARARHEHVTWPLPTFSDATVSEATKEAVTGEQTVTVEIRARTAVDVRTAALGRPLADSLWNFHAHNTMIGVTNDRAVRTDTAPRVAFIDGVVAIAYRNNSGHLSLDLAQRVRSAVNDGGPDLINAQVRRTARHEYALTLPLSLVHVAGSTELRGTLSLSRVGRKPKRYGDALRRRLGGAAPPVSGHPSAVVVLRADEKGARLSGTVRAFPGEYELTTTFGGKAHPSPLHLRVGRTGRARLLAS